MWVAIIMPRMGEAAFVVRPVNWDARREELRALRRAVFVEEQQVPEELEWDEIDPRAYHVLATTSEGSAVGTGRLSLDCQIGRMAVAREWRRRGVGSAVLTTLLDFALKEGCRVVRLHAQTHAIGFYERFGFEVVGDEFDEAGIPHRAMELRLLPEELPRD
jgi:predicted GNAT family N-acyltransferase